MGWSILGALFLHGQSMVSDARLVQVFELLRKSFVMNEKLTSEKHILSFVKKHESALTAVRMLLETSLALSEQALLFLTQVGGTFLGCSIISAIST